MLRYNNAAFSTSADHILVSKHAVFENKPPLF
ncbi:hypothetical protein J2T04_003958 [Chryseobacterium lathyri]|uniref:Uncharacterized protein n=1 Tax=Chryseobacterium lathyri TaxID=395933 RepID=A0ABT9SRG0_9FLAO|nr:hypothetical protein [Chryseobacterium lathyri]